MFICAVLRHLSPQPSQAESDPFFQRITESFRLEKTFKIMESNHFPALPRPPVPHVPKCHLHRAFKSLQGWGLHFFPGQLCQGTGSTYLISWALSWALRGRSLSFLQSRNSCRLVKGSWEMEHLSMSFHTSTPTRATRMFSGL
uniref:Uncharacterized protein n=1 Tax=Serinus canaria TaxID=9135 RepID=A0A8C9UED2_SERCA